MTLNMDNGERKGNRTTERGGTGGDEPGTARHSAIRQWGAARYRTAVVGWQCMVQLSRNGGYGVHVGYRYGQPPDRNGTGTDGRDRKNTVGATGGYPPDGLSGRNLWIYGGEHYRCIGISR